MSDNDIPEEWNDIPLPDDPPDDQRIEVMPANRRPPHSPPASAPSTYVRPPWVRSLAEVNTQETWWGFYPYFPVGWSMIEGDSEVGKGSFLCDLIARWTRGERMPFDTYPMSRQRGRAMYVFTEDNVGMQVEPKVLNAGGVKGNALFVDWRRMRTSEGKRLTLENAKQWIDVIRGEGIGLLVIDPIKSIAGVRNDNDSAEVRDRIEPLIYEIDDIVVIMLRHWNKDSSRGAKHRGAGASAWHEIPRVVNAIAVDPTDESQRVLVPILNNLAPQEDQKSLAFRFRSIGISDALPRGVAGIEWIGESSVTKKDITGLVAPSGAKMSSKDRAEIAIRSFLLGRGEVSSTEMCYEINAKLGIGQDALKRAKKSLAGRGIIDVRPDGFGDGWIARLVSGA